MARDVRVDDSNRSHRSVQVVLRVGLALSVVSMGSGLLVCLITGHRTGRAVRLAELGAPMDPGLRLVTIGILVLCATPAVRVLALVLLWARARDWRFVGLALVVAGVLAASVLVGAR